MPSFHYLNNTLHCEEVNLDELAEEIGTPAYIYSATTIAENYRRFDRSLGSLTRMICYAAKANSNLAVLRLLAKEGAGFDVVSGGELFKVLKAGGLASRCTFAGVGKMADEIQYALEQGIFCFNVESEGELELINNVAGRLGVIAPIALRINPDVDVATHHYISTGKNKNKFGIALNRAESVYKHAAGLPYLKIRGLQTHIGSQILDALPFAEAVEKLSPLILKLKALYSLEFFSIGGGLGIDYNNIFKECESSLEAYATKIIKPLRALGLKIIFEPGRFIVGNAGVLLSTALYRKNTPEKKFLILDAGMNDLIRPALYQGYHEIVALKQKPEPSYETVDVVGPVCESGDFFAQDRKMPHIEPGERVALMSAGAYGMTMASTYNARPLPPEILVEGKKATLVRRRQTWEDLIDHEIIDGKLRD
ncbi:MAG: diaminopimelate decarboxylase [Chthoniobacterales bacterium]